MNEYCRVYNIISKTKKHKTSNIILKNKNLVAAKLALVNQNNKKKTFKKKIVDEMNMWYTI